MYTNDKGKIISIWKKKGINKIKKVIGDWNITESTAGERSLGQYH
jgi:hypothetical protein